MYKTKTSDTRFVTPATSFFSLYDDDRLTITDDVTNKNHLFPSGVNLSLLHRAFYKGSRCIAMLSNNEVLSLSEGIDIDSHISPIPFEGPDALRIFTDSAIMTLICSARRVFPGQILKCLCCLEGGYYLRYEDMDLSKEDVQRIAREMDHICRRRCTIHRETWAYTDALACLERYNHTATYNLLKSRNIARVAMSVMSVGETDSTSGFEGCGYVDNDVLRTRAEDFVGMWSDPYVHDTGVLFDLHNNYEDGVVPGVPSKGKTQHYYHLIPFENGIILYITDETFKPLPENPEDVKLENFLSALLQINDTYKNTCNMMSAPHLAALNRLATDHRALREFINVAEIMHDSRISQIAAMCTRSTRCIFVTGPSSSGKTIFSNRLAVHLRSLAFTPVRISLDDFYRSEDKVPKNPDGSPDFEHLEAINTECIQECLQGLLKDEEVILPHYDFKSHESIPKGGRHLKPTPSTVYIIEGIHALNDKICNVVPQERRLKIFIRPAGSLLWDNLKIVHPSDCRLIRRIARDAATRGCTAERTLKMWKCVRDGEKTWIMDKQKVILYPGGTYMMSSLFYEQLVLRNLALPLLKSVAKTSPVYKDARRLIRMLEPIMPIPASLVPSMSLLNEFLGGSTFDDFCF